MDKARLAAENRPKRASRLTFRPLATIPTAKSGLRYYPNTGASDRDLGLRLIVGRAKRASENEAFRRSPDGEIALHPDFAEIL